VEVDIGEVERHGAALGDLLGLGQGTARGGRVAAAVGEGSSVVSSILDVVGTRL
jgi:hypothetical protein